MVRQKRARSRILHIKNEGGILIEEPKEIENKFVNHFLASYEDKDLHSVDYILNELKLSISLNFPSNNA